MCYFSDRQACGHDSNPLLNVRIWIRILRCGRSVWFSWHGQSQPLVRSRRAGRMAPARVSVASTRTCSARGISSAIPAKESRNRRKAVAPAPCSPTARSDTAAELARLRHASSIRPRGALTARPAIRAPARCRRTRATAHSFAAQRHRGCRANDSTAVRWTDVLQDSRSSPASRTRVGRAELARTLTSSAAQGSHR